MIDESNVQISKTKRLWLIFVPFLVAVFGLSAVVVLYAMGLWSDGTGYAALTAEGDSNLPGYAGGYSATLYFKGNAMSTGQQKKAANNAYSEALHEAYLLTEDMTKREYASSLADLNAGLGENVKLSAEAYALLEQAVGYHKSKPNFSLYAAPLYAEWERIAVVRANLIDKSHDPDPAKDAAEKEYLDELSAILNDENSVKVELLGENTAKLTISEQYAAFRRDNDISAPIISLNHLRPAFMLEAVAKRLEADGWHDGYLSHTLGLGISLSGSQGIAHSLYGLTGTTEEVGGAIALTGGWKYAKFNRLPLNRTSYDGFYAVQVGEGYLFRSPYLNVGNGDAPDYLLSTWSMSSSQSLIDLCLHAEAGCLIQDDAGLASWKGQAGDAELMVYRKEKTDTFYLSSYLRDRSVMPEAGHYQTETL